MSVRLVQPIPLAPTSAIERIQGKLTAVRKALLRNDDSFEFWADQALVLTSVREHLEKIIKSLRRAKHVDDLEDVARSMAARRNAQEALELVSLVETACDQPFVFSGKETERALIQVVGFAASRLQTLQRSLEFESTITVQHG